MANLGWLVLLQDLNFLVALPPRGMFLRVITDLEEEFSKKSCHKHTLSRILIHATAGDVMKLPYFSQGETELNFKKSAGKCH